MDESRALRHAAWAGAGSIVLLTVAVALGYLVGVDDPGMSDSAILERLNDDERQVEDLRRARRVWFLFGHVVQTDGLDDDKRLLHLLDRIGVQLDARHEPGASLYLYDLSRAP